MRSQWLLLRNASTSAVFSQKGLPSYASMLDYMKRPLSGTCEHFNSVKLQPLCHRVADLAPLYRGTQDQRDASSSQTYNVVRHQICASYLPVAFQLSPSLS